MEGNNSWFLHVDLDAFFASVEQLDNPSYKGKPVIVGGKPTDLRSVVSTASYEARKYGVHSAMPTSQAYKLCPNGIYVYGRMQRYSEISSRIMDILKNYSPDVEQMSIDEAFLDITGTEKLFGPPEQTAFNIKNQIKKEVGLTVSIGLARTKYMAKIASDINKPDGFCFVKPGTEKDLMLTLPLGKVFGLGNKTEEILKKAGIKTTKDIYEKSLESLQFITNQNTGFFLYNAVRGLILEKKDKQVKSHSLSAETTFPIDLFDMYTAETSLLELAHDVFFRLLKESGSSKTVMVKIRYEDFSTVTIQQTYSKNILTIDTLYLYAKELFEKKYERNKGIRLLGIGLENIDNKKTPVQGELFYDNDEKKQKVEKAILNLEKKHPQIKIHKARMLEKFNNTVKSIILIFIFCLCFNTPSYSKDNITKQKGAASLTPDSLSQTLPKTQQEKDRLNEFFTWDIQGSYKANVIFSTSFDSFDIPVFKQEIDLTAMFAFNNTLFFDLQFLDDYNKNLYQIKYKGTKNLKEIRFANRNIIFPKEYSSNLTGYSINGGNNQAPGIIAHIEDSNNSKYIMDAIIRYDMTKTSSATFYGTNKVTETKIQLNEFVTSNQFYIPLEECIDNILDLYVQNSNGQYKDKNGIKYKKLSPNEYLILAEKKLLIINPQSITQIKQDAKPNILITFTQESYCSLLNSYIGSYTNPNSYCGKIQVAFNKNYPVNLQDYTYNILTQIDNTNAVQIQFGKYFSPFEVLNKYDCNFSSSPDISLYSDKAQTQCNDFTINIDNSLTTFANEDYIKQNHKYAIVKNNLINNIDYDEPINRYPFAEINPYIYLQNKSSLDYYLSLKNYTNLNNIQIEKDLDENSVKVYINGQLDSNAKYESSSGIITPSKSITNSDKIYITFLEDSNEIQTGSFNTAFGLLYNINKNLKVDFNLTGKYPFTAFTNYSTKDNINNAFLALTGGINLEKDKLKIQDALSLSIENSDTTGIFLISNSLLNSNQTYYLSDNSGYITKNIPSLNGQSFPNMLTSQTNCTITNHDGVKDENITGYKIPLSFDFSLAQNTNAWASVDIKLNGADSLKNATEFEFALQTQEDLSDYELFIQLGINANQNTTLEESFSIPTYKIETPQNSNWQIYKLELTLQDRAKFLSYHDARLIIVKKDSVTPLNPKATIYFGPYSLIYDGIFTTQAPEIFVKSYSVQANNSNAYSFIKDDIYSSLITWQILDSTISQEDKNITLVDYFDAATLDEYENLCIDIKANNHQDIQIILDSDYQDAKSTGNCAVNLLLNSSIFSSELKWHTIKINLNESHIYLDDILLSDSYTLTLNKNVTPSRIKTILSELSQSGEYEQGSIYLQNTKTNFKTKNYFYTEYKPIKELTLQLTSTQVIGTNNIKGIFNANYNNFKNDISLDTSFDAKNIGYSIKTTEPLFNLLNYNFTYRYNLQENAITKSDFINIKKDKIFNIDLSDIAKINNFQNEQNLLLNMNFTPTIKNKIITINSNSNFEQKNNSSNKIAQNVFSGYIDIFEQQFDIGSNDDLLRKISFENSIAAAFSNNFKPILKYNLKEEYKTGTDFSNNFMVLTNITIPFKISNNNFSFAYTKTAQTTSNNTAQNYFDDFSSLNDSNTNISWYYTALPIVDLFNNNFYTCMNNSHFETTLYNSKYEFSWKQKHFAFNSILTRDIKTGTNYTDIYQTKNIFSSKFYNIFVQKGSIPLIKYYTQDEFNSSISYIYKINGKNNNSSLQDTWLLSCYATYLLFKDNSNTLKNGIDLTFNSSDEYQIRTTSILSYSGKNCLFLFIPKLFYKDETKYSYQITRTDTLNCTFKKTQEDYSQCYDFNHSCNLLINKNFNFKCGLGTIFENFSDKESTLKIQAELGVNITF